MKNNNKGKILAIMGLALIMIASTAISIAYWATTNLGVQNTDQTTNITIGEGQTVTATFTLSAFSGSELPLAPAIVNGQPNTQPDVALSAVRTITATWASSADTVRDTYTGNVTVALTSASATGGITAGTHDVTNLFNLSVTGNTTPITINDTQDLTLTITMLEPADKEEYEKIATSTVTLTFTFTVTPN
jgi:hypothetical protein